MRTRIYSGCCGDYLCDYWLRGKNWREASYPAKKLVATRAATPGEDHGAASSEAAAAAGGDAASICAVRDDDRDGASSAAARPPSSSFAFASVPGLPPAVGQLLRPDEDARRIPLPVVGGGRDVDGHGNTPLHWAAFEDSQRAMAVLLSHGAYVNARAQPSGWTPLHDAAYSDAAGAVALLIGAGAEVDARSHSRTRRCSASRRRRTRPTRPGRCSRPGPTPRFGAWETWARGPSTSGRTTPPTTVTSTWPWRAVAASS